MNPLPFQRTVLRDSTILGGVGGQTHDSMIETFRQLFDTRKVKYKNLRLEKPSNEPVPLAVKPKTPPQAAVR